jgi:hypothetical protein
MTRDKAQPRLPKTHLFTLRLWYEAWGDGRGEVRFQVKHVLSGETRYFRDGAALLAYLETLVRDAGSRGKPSR